MEELDRASVAGRERFSRLGRLRRWLRGDPVLARVRRRRGKASAGARS